MLYIVKCIVEFDITVSAESEDEALNNADGQVRKQFDAGGVEFSEDDMSFYIDLTMNDDGTEIDEDYDNYDVGHWDNGDAEGGGTK